MAEKDDAQESKAAESNAPKKGKKKLVIIAAAAILILAGAGVPMFMMGGDKEEGELHEEEDHKTEHEPHLVTAAPDVFVVNLSETGAFLKVKMLLEFDEGPLKTIEEELIKKGVMHAEGAGGHGSDGSKSTLSGYMKFREPMIRDSVIKILSSRRANDVLSLTGKEKLKEEILEGINEALAMDESPVQAVYFQEFIIQ